MKMIILVSILVITAVIFAACGGSSTDEDYFIDYTTENGFDYGGLHDDNEDYNEIQFVEIEGVMREIRPRGSLTIDDFLADLDYMVYVLENNFALLDVAYWAHGIDYKELAEQARRLVLDMDEPCEDTFLAIVSYSFMPLLGTGHFQIVGHSTHASMANNSFYGGYLGRKHLMNVELVRSPLARRFYTGNTGHIHTSNTAMEQLIELYGMPFNRLLAGEPSISQPVTTEIIEEGRIAYISSGRNMAELANAQNQIFSFKREIADFDHLILDLRGNIGGNVGSFLHVLLRPHLREATEAPLAFYFFQDSPYIRRFGDLLFEATISSGGMTITEPYRPAEEILAAFDLPEINHDDIARLHYGAPARFYSLLIPNWILVAPDFEFNGKIWMLTDESMGSASTAAPWIAKEMGFATLVGETTAGVLGGPRTLAFMPNTGIIFYFDMFYLTDSRGRPLEAGVIPHHFNREGMDALETTLALIYEGEW